MQSAGSYVTVIGVVPTMAEPDTVLSCSARSWGEINCNVVMAPSLKPANSRSKNLFLPDAR